MQDTAQTEPPRWQPLSAIDRRVAGVLVEKAKTTPDAYPLSLNAIVTAANQKNNRYPLMELEAEAAQESVDRLRGLGAIALVQGSSRVDRFRHLLYDWLRVDKVELAVMAELLLRGAQTEGELRGRAARMEPIADVAALRPVLDSLKAKKLILSLTREGRGHVLSHALYQPRELERLQAEFSSADAGDDREPPRAAATNPGPAAHVAAHREPVREAAPTAPAHASSQSYAAPAARPADSAELMSLRSELRQAQESITELQSAVEDCRREIRELREALGA